MLHHKVDVWRHPLFYYDDVTWMSCSLKSPFIRLIVSQLMWTHITELSKSSLLAPCEENSAMTGEFPAQGASNAEKASIWWRYHDEDIFKAWNDRLYIILSLQSKTMTKTSHERLNVRNQRQLCHATACSCHRKWKYCKAPHHWPLVRRIHCSISHKTGQYCVKCHHGSIVFSVVG